MAAVALTGYANVKGSAGRVGPFQDANGNLLIFGMTSTRNAIACWRSTDGGVTWTQINQGGLANNQSVMDCVYVSSLDRVYVAYCASTSSPSVTAATWFDCASASWGSSSSNGVNLYANVTSGQLEIYVGADESKGLLVVYFNSAPETVMGKSKSRTSFITAPLSTLAFGTAVVVSPTGTSLDYVVNGLAVDTYYLFSYTSSGSIGQPTVIEYAGSAFTGAQTFSTGTTETAIHLRMDTIIGSNIGYIVTPYDTGLNSSNSYRLVGGPTPVYTADSSTPDLEAGPNRDQKCVEALFSPDSNKRYLIYVPASDPTSLEYVTITGSAAGTWGTPTTLESGYTSIRNVSAYKITNAIGVVFNDNDTTTYFDKIVTAATGNTYTDAATISSASSITSTDVTADVDAISVVGKTTPANSDAVASTDATTISSRTTPITTFEGKVNTDAATISTTSSLTTPTDVVSYADANIVKSSSSIISSEVVADVDATVVAGTTSLSALEGKFDLEQATVSSTTTPASLEQAAYVETGSVSGITSVSTLESKGVLDSNTVSSSTTPSSTDALAAIESASIASTSVVTSTELHGIPDSGTTNGSTSVTSQETAQYVDAGNPTGVSSVSSTEGREITDAATVPGLTSIQSSDELVLGGTNYTESAAVASVTNPTSPEVAGYVDSANLSSQTSVGAIDLQAGQDQSVVSGASTVSIADVVSYSDSAESAGTTSITSSEVIPSDTAQIAGLTGVISDEQLLHGLEDVDTVATETSTSGTETAAFADISVIESDSAVSSAENRDMQESSMISGVSSLLYSDILGALDASTISGSTSLISGESRDITDSATITGVSTPVAVEIAGYVDTASYSTKTSINSTEVYSTSGQDSAVVKNSTTPSSIDVASFTDTNLVIASTTVGGSEYRSVVYTDSAVVESTTTPLPVGIFVGRDADTVNSTSAVLDDNFIIYIDSDSPMSFTSALSNEVTGLLETSTINTFTYVSYSEVYEPPDAFIDFATVSTLTSVRGSEGQFIVGAFALVGTLRVRWWASAMIPRLVSSARKRWLSQWKG